LTLLAESGIRVGEALGLAWPCVDLEAETIAIIGQLGPDGEVRETTTMCRRVIPISARAASVLREHRTRMLEQGQDVTIGLVFVTWNGKPQSKRNALRAWSAALDKIGVDANLHASGTASSPPTPSATRRSCSFPTSSATPASRRRRRTTRASAVASVSGSSHCGARSEPARESNAVATSTLLPAEM
jgi:integrase